MNPVFGIVDVEQDAPWHLIEGSKLPQNNSTIAAIMRLSAVAPARF